MCDPTWSTLQSQETGIPKRETEALRGEARCPGSQLVGGQTRNPYQVSNVPDVILAQAPFTGWNVFVPDVHMAPSLLSFRSLLQCYLPSETSLDHST